jgi:hypothetical protein
VLGSRDHCPTQRPPAGALHCCAPARQPIPRRAVSPQAVGHSFLIGPLCSSPGTLVRCSRGKICSSLPFPFRASRAPSTTSRFFAAKLPGVSARPLLSTSHCGRPATRLRSQTFSGHSRQHSLLADLPPTSTFDIQPIRESSVSLATRHFHSQRNSHEHAPNTCLTPLSAHDSHRPSLRCLCHFSRRLLRPPSPAPSP